MHTFDLQCSSVHHTSAWNELRFECGLALGLAKGLRRCGYITPPSVPCRNSHKEHKLAFRWPISRGAKLTAWIIPSCLVASIRRRGCGAEDKLGLSFVASLIILSKPFRQICPVGPIYSEIYEPPIWTREEGKIRHFCQLGEINCLVFQDDRDDVSESI